MERPFFGRTGLLDSGRGGPPVIQPRLRPRSSGPVELRWCPRLLTAPQALVAHCGEGRPVDDSLVALLRLGSMAALLGPALGLEPVLLPTLHQRLLQWHRQAFPSRGREEAVFTSPPALTWYVPEYKLVIIKEGASVGSVSDVSRRSVTLLGKDRGLNDVPLDHPSCSAQHAALEVAFALAGPVEEGLRAELTAEVADPAHELGPCPLGADAARQLLQAAPNGPLTSLMVWLWGRLVELQREEWAALDPDAESAVGGSGAAQAAYDARGATSFWSLEVMLTDLGSTNGTTVNGARLAPFTPTALIEGDVVAFGMSSRQYVVMRAAGR